MYSYKLNDLDNFIKNIIIIQGDGLTYNSKKDKVLVIGLNSLIYEYNGQVLIREKEYKTPTYTAIGYDYNNDLYWKIYVEIVFS